MGRYKGQMSARAVEKRFPHIVEMVVPEHGFRDTTREMHAWYQQRGLHPLDGQGFYLEPHFYVHACFEDPEDAEAFATQFGGQLIGPGRLFK